MQYFPRGAGLDDNGENFEQATDAISDVLDITPASVDITVVDEGVGFDACRAAALSAHRFGLAQLRERVRTAGGVLGIDTVVGEGCRVTLRSEAATRLNA